MNERLNSSPYSLIRTRQGPCSLPAAPFLVPPPDWHCGMGPRLLRPWGGETMSATVSAEAVLPAASPRLLLFPKPTQRLLSRVVLIPSGYFR